MMMYEEEDLLPISALQHLLFCERRAALVHTECLWDENKLTAEGRVQHEHAHEGASDTRGDLRTVRGLRVRSLALGLVGTADVVEFHLLNDAGGGKGVSLEGAAGLWQPVPIEYKSGRLRREEGYEVQLCAQALCLEEMLHCNVPAGSIYYGKTRRRLEVAFDVTLRKETKSASARLHQLMRSNSTPEPSFGPKCQHCSLEDLCLPKLAGSRRKVAGYLAAAVAEASEADR